uniref:C2H2-type domain-containing protein n=1 Tax=Acanthochromis polyacanthus TaxID=80966 RepID=A0A3Q1GVI7_9TELE
MLDVATFSRLRRSARIPSVRRSAHIPPCCASVQRYNERFKTVQTWLRTGAIREKCAEQGENTSSRPLETEVDDNEASTSAGGYSSSITEAESTTPASIINKRRKTVRRYDSRYQQFGFSWIGTEEEPRPQCVVCGDVLSNESMKPVHLRRHLLTKHPGLKDKTLDFFVRKRGIVPASYNWRAAVSAISQRDDAHHVWEKAAKQLNLVPLSNDTVSRLERIKSSRYYAIQLDETTDVADLANLLVYVRYECGDAAQEDFLFCRSLETRTTAEHIFQLLDAFVTENGLDWSKCVGLCTDGARAMTGRHSDVAARVREVAAQMRWTHCSIHREALAIKRMLDNLKSVLDSAVKSVNFIKARPIMSNSYFTEKVLLRLFELHREVQMFLQDKNFPLSDVFDDTVWLSQLAYLADIFSLNAMLKKMELFEIKIKTGDVSAFPALESFLSDNDLNLDAEVRDSIVAHLVSLRLQFSEYLPVMAEANNWMRNPFSIETSDMPNDFTLSEHESLIELSCDETLKSAVKNHWLLDFWIKQRGEYPAVSDKAVHFLLPFTMTYLCEKGFSTLAVIKIKYRSRMDAEPDLRLKLTSVEPDFAALCARRQGYPSH